MVETDDSDEPSPSLQLPAEINWERLDKSRFFFLGAALFSAVSAALYPTVVLKTRLQVAKPPFPSATCATFLIFRQEGPLAFYRGFATSLAGTVPARALYMTALELTKSTVGHAALQLGMSDPTASAVASAAAGVSAAVAAQFVWTPIDVVSQRLMVQGNSRNSTHYKYIGGLDAFRKILCSDGIYGLYRGFGMSILTYAPSNAVWWASYSLSQKAIWEGIGFYLCRYRYGLQESDPQDLILKPDQRTVVAVQAASATMAGGAAALVTMPLDTIKTRMQVMDERDGGRVTVYRTIRSLVREGGWGACFRGLGPRWASMSVSATTMITTYEFLKRLSCKRDEG
ncbi:solute carrier family 25 member 44 [Carex littledalei]|uniref:Solute carrier family 25 member 44 n=1 Tax=Carex littledalei TaxID=544730 RepID=A0A833RC50_9POAL|nr:solute carrier family 25 member 44 [Carex littledalei]